MALQAAGRARVRVLAIVVIAIAGLAALVWSRRQRTDPETSSVNLASPAASPSRSRSPVIIQSPEAPTPEDTPERSPTPANVIPLADSFIGTLKLIIPVAGVKPDQLIDTFADARSEGRVHDAIDIPAPAGTHVVAVADGEIIKLFQSERGGTTIYQLSSDRRLVFYYAHLQGYAEGLAAGMFVKQGDVIGYVGDTGNAGAGNFHLHFSISVVADPKRYWEGTNINPYPLLRK
ncbi:MAG TPA: M23 family metallopeptidase [Pyrinomonadaceae bacterium]|nr:M23 family metallopeptidase [Pyrinomonadaceae bacterium]